MSDHQTRENGSKSRDFGAIFSLVIAPLIILCIVIAFFGDTLFFSSDKVLSKEGEDLFSQYVHYRDFGFTELRKGNLALWNPHIFSGIPFLGGFQSALLYPFNLIYLILPLAKAINAEIALHVFLAGISMYCWTAYRGLHPFARLFSAMLFMFCGPFFLHIYAGHLSNLGSMAWAPLVLLAVDGLVDKRSLGWCLFGMFAVAMQLLAGHPQYVFYTGVTAAIYAGMLLVGHKQRLRIALGILAIYVGAAALSAVQLIPGIQAGSESIRGMGVPYEFAAEFSFAPENLATLLAPGFFGDIETILYWGRDNFWEMNLFVSVTGFMLCLVGAMSGDRNIRRFSACMVLILLVLAFGAHTPLFRFLYSFVPGFNKFRGSSKFIFFAALYIIMLAGIGFDGLIRTRKIPRRAAIFSFGGALLLAALGLGIRYSAGTGGEEGLWAKILLAMQNTGDSQGAEETYIYFFNKSALFASKYVLISSGLFGLSGVIFLLLRISKKVVYLFTFFAMAELLFFASGFRPTFDLQATQIPELTQLKARNIKDDRILNLANPNSTISLRMNNIWGGDPGVVRRYAQFITYTQGEDPDEATQNVDFSRLPDLYEMLRCRYAIVYKGKMEEKRQILENKDAMPVGYLIDEYRLIRDRNQIFEEMLRPGFSPWRTVILETLPEPAPVKSKEKGTVKVVKGSTDHLIIEANLPSPKILLITDAYSRGWRVRPLSQNAQQSYKVLPANYVLQAIPLESGKHSFVLEYSPLAFRMGKWISLVSVFMYAVALSWYLVRRRPFKGRSNKARKYISSN
ncbi:MAG: hypothetical protein ISS61_06390 [Desulfobacteraceae bacterium]|nr:hypothetical protein [Desulfobacteraceae bacterium]